MPDPRHQILKAAATALVVAVVCLWLLLVTGCATTRSGQGSPVLWWNPLTWASRAAPAAADRAADARDDAQAKADAAQAKATHAAHVEIAKADVALAAAPASRPVEVARRTTANALGILDQIRPLTAEEAASVRQLVADLLSDKAETVAQAERQQRAAETELARAGRDLDAARQKLEAREAALVAANANLRAAYDRENALANQVRTFWFVLGGLALLLVGSQLLAVAARFVPALAPIATAANLVTAPALAFAESRARTGLQKVGYAMARARTALPEAADRLTEIFDQEADDDHKRVIGAAANHAPRT
jgi:hypothetical protein